MYFGVYTSAVRTSIGNICREQQKLLSKAASRSCVCVQSAICASSSRRSSHSRSCSNIKAAQSKPLYSFIVFRSALLNSQHQCESLRSASSFINHNSQLLKMQATVGDMVHHETSGTLATKAPLHANGVGNHAKTLSGVNMNQHVKNVQYAVRGPIVQKATNYEQLLKKGDSKHLPFTEVIKANIGDCQAMLQKPITFLRQVLAVCTYPELATVQPALFPKDVMQRAREILDGCPGGSVGSYSESTGHLHCRQVVKKFIEERDAFQSDTDHIMLSNGASEMIKLTLLTCTFGEGKNLTGVMIPVPQYPLYSATISEIGAERVDYFLDEANLWSLSIDELKRSYGKACERCVPRVLCVINPGNPTGQVLKRENIDAIIEFAATHNLVLLADEVYQDNVYAEGAQFCSFKKALRESQYSETLELVSFHSMSKGFMGECGIRGGYGEFVNFDPEVLSEIKKLKSAQLCSAVSGQVALSIVLNPPKPGEESYDLFMKEKNSVLGTLKRKSVKVHTLFESMPGIVVNPIMGAMYCFPKIELPQKAIEQAQKIGVAPDAFYVEQLLDHTGICVVAGSGFGQLPGTFHFRTTILPPEEKIDVMLAKFKDFHLSFLQKYQ